MEDLTIVSQELLLALFNYNDKTGEFTRKITTGTKAKIGSVAGIINDAGYVEIIVNSYKYKAHRLAWLYYYGVFPSSQIDHIDNNRANNSINNLREATNTQNAYNKSISKLNSTGFKGVSLDKRSGRYRAYITIDKKQKSLGYYATAEEAGAAYVTAAKNLHKEFFNENIAIS